VAAIEAATVALRANGVRGFQPARNNHFIPVNRHVTSEARRSTAKNREAARKHRIMSAGA